MSYKRMSSRPKKSSRRYLFRIVYIYEPTRLRFWKCRIIMCYFVQANWLVLVCFLPCYETLHGLQIILFDFE